MTVFRRRSRYLGRGAVAGCLPGENSDSPRPDRQVQPSASRTTHVAAMTGKGGPRSSNPEILGTFYLLAPSFITSKAGSEAGAGSRLFWLSPQRITGLIQTRRPCRRYAAFVGTPFGLQSGVRRRVEGGPMNGTGGVKPWARKARSCAAARHPTLSPTACLARCCFRRQSRGTCGNFPGVEAQGRSRFSSPSSSLWHSSLLLRTAGRTWRTRFTGPPRGSA
ncbi:hypothetical protein EV126DRAFT_101137 [Verticillium dahliae]|nr:hypothetical protein EV126DRAFT_101137 [Verticillium dahliae]